MKIAIRRSGPLVSSAASHSRLPPRSISTTHIANRNRSSSPVTRIHAAIGGSEAIAIESVQCRMVASHSTFGILLTVVVAEGWRSSQPFCARIAGMSRPSVSGRARGIRVLPAVLVPLLFGGLIAQRAITEPKNDFRFSIIGDRTGGAQPQIFGRVWREVDLLHPDFVITVGDTIQGGIDEVAEDEWRDLRPIWQRYSHYPLYFTPGNHDVFSDTSRQLYERETRRPPFYSFDYQEAHFTVLDNSRTTDLSPGQLEFLAKDLEANKGKRPKFIFFHKPYWIAPLMTGATQFPLHQIARKYGVEHIISGHGHQFVRIVREGIA